MICIYNILHCYEELALIEHVDCPRHHQISSFGKTAERNNCRIDDNYSISIAESVSNYFWMIWKLHLELLAGQKIDQIWPGQIYAYSVAISICNHYRISKTTFPKVQVAITASIVQPLLSRRLGI